MHNMCIAIWLKRITCGEVRGSWYTPALHGSDLWLCSPEGTGGHFQPFDFGCDIKAEDAGKVLHHCLPAGNRAFALLRCDLCGDRALGARWRPWRRSHRHCSSCNNRWPRPRPKTRCFEKGWRTLNCSKQLERSRRRQVVDWRMGNRCLWEKCSQPFEIYLRLWRRWAVQRVW